MYEQQLPRARTSSTGELIYLPSVRQAKLMSLGYSALIADYYWVKALQYYTEPANASRSYRNLGDYLELVLGLDPEFRYAYKFAGMAVPYEASPLRWRNTTRATDFLRRGVERFPDHWELHFLLGYNLLNFHNRPIEAAEQFAIAARLPGAPAYLNAFAARVYSVGGDLDRALEFAEEVVKVTDDPEILALMRERLDDLREEKAVRQLEAAVTDFRTRYNRVPSAVAELVASGAITGSFPGFSIDSSGRAHGPRGRRMELHRNENSGDFQVDD